MAQQKKIRFDRVTRSLSKMMQECQVAPETVIGAALALWCSQSFPGLPRSGLPAPETLQQHPAVVAFIDFIKGDELQEATYWFASTYARLAGGEHRKRLAMFFTPPSLTNRLLEDLTASGTDFAKRSFCDPACGGAAFLTPIAIRMRDALCAKGATSKQVLEHVQACLFGIDKDDTLCKLSGHFIRMALHREILAAGTEPQFQVVHGDSLLESQSSLYEKVDIIVCNPPFRKLSATEVEAYRDEFSDIIEGQTNIYALFMALCVKLLKTGGICALVTPTSFLSGRYFSKLRSHFSSKTKILSIGMVGDREGIFIDVEQETSLTLARREDDRHALSSDTEIFVVSREGHYVDVGRCQLPRSGSVWPIPRSENDIGLLRNAANSKARIADYGYAVRIGAFVWNRDTRPTYDSAKSADRADSLSVVPLLWSSDIAAGGNLRFDGSPKTNNEPCFVDLGSKLHPSVVRRPSVLLQRVTSNEQPKRLVAAAVPAHIYKKYGGFVGENHTVILEQIGPNPALSPKEMAQLLGTPPVDRYFRCISGATNVSAFELKQLRLPDPKRLRNYLTQGYEIVDAAWQVLSEEAHGI